MICLKDYIGLAGCGSTTPLSGLYVNELPGVTLEMIDKLTEADQITYLGVWNDVQKRAAARLANTVNGNFRQRYSLKAIRETLYTGNVLTDKVVPMAAEFRGVEVRIASQSALQSIYVSDLYVYLTAPVANLRVGVADIEHHVPVFTTNIDGKEGWNAIEVKRDFRTHHLFAGYDATDVDGLQIPLLEDVDNWCRCMHDTFGSKSEVRGAVYDSNINTIVANTDYTASFVAAMSAHCSYEPFICDNLDVFKTVYWYLLGAELMFERMYTGRLNRFTTVDRQKAEELRKEFTEIANAELETALSGIRLDTADPCLECNQTVINVEVRP